MENDKEVPIEFPASGLNVATSYGQQPKGSAPIGVNVRSNESILNRERGGSRSGLSKYPPGLLPSGTNVVQHMNIVVDPQGGALLAGSFITGPTEADPDPRWGGRLIRVGGDGIQLNRNQNRQTPQVFVQSQAFQAGGPGGSLGNPQTMVFTNKPSGGNLLFVLVATLTYQVDGFTGPAHPGVPKNGAGTSYTHLGSTGFVDITVGPPASSLNVYQSLSCYYLISTGITADKTVNVDPAGGEQITIAGCEYTSLNTLSPYDNSVTFTDATQTSDAATTGPILLSNTAGEVVIAVVVMGNTSCSGVTPAGGFTIRLQSYSDTGGTGWNGSAPFLALMDKTGVQATTITPTGTLLGGFTPSPTGLVGPTFCSIGAAFKK